MTRVLVTGAAGTVGYNVLTQLRAQSGIDVVAFVRDTRSARKRLAPFSDYCRCIFGDITNPKQVFAACEGVDVAIHLAALIPPEADRKPELANQINVGGTANLIRGLEVASPSAFILYSSSISVYGDRVCDPDIRVGDPLVPSMGDEYAKTKIAAETLLQESALDWGIFRLTAIMGGHAISPLLFHMPLKTRIEIASPADAARAFVKAIDHRESLKGRIFNLGGGPKCRISYAEFLRRSFQIMGMDDVVFPEGAFATHNFHCGNYVDGDDLEQLLHFRKDTLETYFAKFEQSIPNWEKRVSHILRRSIVQNLLRQSEPWRVWRGKTPGYERFFGPRL